jgi:formyl-CoA transferase
MSSRPLHGLSVVELGFGTATGLAGRIMAGYGADVVKIESPEGDPSRHRGPFPPGAEGPETSAAFLHLHGGKSSVVLDLDDVGSRADLVTLLAGADVLLLDLPLPARSGLGLERTALRATYPRLVAVSVTPYGESGPQAGWTGSALTEYASGGQMSLMGERDREPLASYGNQAECQAALHVYSAALAGVLLRDRAGSGQYVEISVQEVQASAMEAQGPVAYNHDPLPDVWTARSGNGPRTVWSQYVCKDGYAGIFVNPPNLPGFFAGIGHPEWLSRAADDGFMNGELRQFVTAWCRERTRQEIFEAAIATGAPFSYVATPADLLGSEVVARTGVWREVDHPVAGRFRVPGPPVRAEELEFELRRAPLLGEHTDDVLRGAKGAST